MSAILQLLFYIKNYKRPVAINIICNILMVAFSVVSIPLLIPFLEILMQRDTTPPQLVKPEWAFNLIALKNWFYYQLYYLKNTFGAERALIFVCIALCITFFFKNLFKYLALYFITPMRSGVVRDLRQRIIEKSLRLPLSYFSEERKGDLISRITNDVHEVEWSILNVLESIVREPFSIIGALIMMIILSPSLTLFVLILLVVTGGIVGGIGRTLKRDSGVLQQKLGDVVSIVDETLGGMRVIKGFNAENYQAQKFKSENNAFRRLINAILRKRDMSSPLTEFLGIVIVSVLIVYGFTRVQAGGLSPEGFISFLYAFFTVIEPAKAYSQAYYNIQKGAAALERINTILDADEVIMEVDNPIPIKDFKHQIEYRNVSFVYKNEGKIILKNINLTIPKGKVIALVGASGAGKSTIADLLPRFYDTTEGGIFIDNIDIKTLKIKDLRNLMGIVTQEAVLFNDTIYNNIVFGLDNVKQDDVISAAKAANAHDFILLTEGGYQTNIGDRGNKLSGGQRQRLTIARALLRNPQILILDEATSALDSESEKLVQAALSELMRGRTAIVIAHRLSTVQNADEIIVLREGEIIERGTHDALIAQNGEYKKLVDLQGLA
jgi:subfamily B ATP-binding cassette protein MsbA